jgi:4-diphosphocytidyl-2-C-methyl-D-erythritol kinase
MSGRLALKSLRGQPPYVSVRSFTLPSFAKINWVLRVLGRRQDGFHELLTVFQTITLHDKLKFTARDDDRLQLTCDSMDIPVDERNLVLRAALALRDRYGIRRGASIHLEKVIPVEGGLGGGSSNAAIALLGLSNLWDVKTDKRELTEMGARLGADVPFFLTGGTALGTGLGTNVRPMDEVTAGHLLIVKPHSKVSTAQAYKSLNAPALTKADSDIILSISCADEQFTDFHPDALHNDFEPVVFHLKPEIERVKDTLLRAGARSALLAGSGSSVFGFFDASEGRRRALEIVEKVSGWRLFPCATLSRTAYMEVLGACAAPLVGERAMKD